MIESMVRPEDLEGFVGQYELVKRLRTVMAGSRARETRPPHVLLSGPAGTGKTTMARIVAHELGAKLIVTSGPALKRPDDIAGLLMSIDGDEQLTVLFVDEIHRLSARVEETLYEALEDGAVSIVVGKGGEARAMTIKAPALVCVGATTKPGSLSAPLRDRFGFRMTMAPYTVDELAFIVGREWTRQGFEFTFDAAMVVAGRARGVPRVALHLAARVLDVVAISKAPLTGRNAADALDSFGIGDGGLDELDWAIIRALTKHFAGRPVGLDALAQYLDVDAATIEDEHEGPLVRGGYLVRTASGRMATPEAFAFARRR